MPCIIHACIFWKKCLCGLHVLFKIFVVLFISVSPTGLFSEPNVLYFAKISEIYRHVRQSERNFQLLFYKILSLQQESERITYEIYIKHRLIQAGVRIFIITHQNNSFYRSYYSWSPLHSCSDKIPQCLYKRSWGRRYFCPHCTHLYL